MLRSWLRRIGWKRLALDEFSLAHPRWWRLRREDGHLHLSPPHKSVHLMVAAFRKAGGSVDEVFKTKLSAQAEVFPPEGAVSHVAGPNWSGFRHETEDRRPERQANTRRVLLCAGEGDLYVTLSLYLDPREHDAHRATYERILGSLEFR